MLRQHVQTVDRRPDRLDAAGDHLSGEDRLLQQLAWRLGNEPTHARLTDEVAGAADSLQGAGDVAGRADLTDEIDRSHVDAQFQRGRRHHGRQTTFFQGRFDLLTHFQRHAAVMGAGDFAFVVEERGDASAERRSLVKTMVERCSRISSLSRR